MIKRYFLSTLDFKMIILPRQARDKHRESSNQWLILADYTDVLAALSTGSMDPRGIAGLIDDSFALLLTGTPVRETPLLTRPVFTKTDSVRQT